MALISRGSYNIGFKLEGNWFKFNDFVNSTNVLYAMAARQGQMEFAEAYRDAVKKNIKTGGKRFGYPQNSGRYLPLKIRKGGGSVALNWSGTFADSVEIFENRVGTRYMVGIQKGIRRPSYYKGDKNKLTVSEYANILEHGTGKIPARPIFKDTFAKDLGGKNGLRVTMEMAIMRRFGSRGIIVTKSF